MIHLSKHKVLQIRGPDAEKFLQGQTTNDVSALKIGNLQLSSHCNHKGRMISSFMLGKSDDETYTLRVHDSLYEVAAEALKKYLVFSIAELSGTDHQICLFDGNIATVKLEQMQKETNALLLQSPDHGFTECYCTDADLAKLASIIGVKEPDKAELWDHIAIKKGIGEVRLETSEQFLPQELNLDLTNGVNFKKGCYTGQEVIARLHYRGKSKKRLRYGQLHSAAANPIGSKVFEQKTGKVFGEIVTTYRLDAETWEFLAVVQNDALQANCGLDLESDTKIQWLPFSYAIP